MRLDLFEMRFLPSFSGMGHLVVRNRDVGASPKNKGRAFPGRVVVVVNDLVIREADSLGGDSKQQRHVGRFQRIASTYGFVQGAGGDAARLTLLLYI